MSPSTGAVPPPAAEGAKVLLGRYELGRLLGRGASAKVYLARDLLTGRAVAIKSFPNPRAGEKASNGSSLPPRLVPIEREAAILPRLRHRHVLRLHEILATRKKVHFVLELAGGGEILSLLDSSGRMPEELSRHYFRQLISAVQYCHSRGVYHRDIKLENLLIDSAGDLKVADFGLGALSDDHLHLTLCGTPTYVAPEILSRKGYHPAKVDVWSCGVVLFVLAAGYLPFNHTSISTIYRKICRGEFRCPNWFSLELCILLRRILDPNPATRIDVDGIVNDPWFRVGIGEDELATQMRGDDEEAWFKTEFKEDMARDMTAFDILTFSSGCDLSRLFRARPGRERFFMGEPGETVLGRVEEAGRKAGFRVRWDGNEETGPVFVEADCGSIVAKVGAFRIAEKVSAVEVVKGDSTEAVRFWKHWLKPAVKPQTVEPGWDRASACSVE